jgi:hypothetical protein
VLPSSPGNNEEGELVIIDYAGATLSFDDDEETCGGDHVNKRKCHGMDNDDKDEDEEMVIDDEEVEKDEAEDAEEAEDKVKCLRLDKKISLS